MAAGRVTADQRGQVGAVALGQQLLGQEGHDRGDGAVQDGAEEGVDQVEAVLQDQDDHLAGLDARPAQACGRSRWRPSAARGSSPAGRAARRAAMMAAWSGCW